MKRKPRVFVSYSWDDVEHQDWVWKLASNLRDNGIDATFDRFLTQCNTVHLQTMMVDNIRNADFILIVMTPNYSQRADQQQGGVGTETRIILDVINENKNKIIPILRGKKGKSSETPYYLKGFLYSDFIDDELYEKNIEKLLYRIYEYPELTVPKIGETPNLISHTFKEDKKVEQQLINFEIPNLYDFTDRDKNKFVNDSFHFINEGLSLRLQETKKLTAILIMK